MKLRHSFLESKGAVHLLKDPNILAATAATKSSNRDELTQSGMFVFIRHWLRNLGRLRDEARKNIIANFESKIPKEDIKLVLDSLSDSNNHLLAYRHPIDMLIGYLTTYFNPNQPDGQFSLAVCTPAV